MDSPSSELERKTQELYSARITIETLNTHVRNAEEENNELKAALHESEEFVRSRSNLVAINRQQQDRIADLEQAQIKEKEDAEYITHLERQVQELKSKLESGATAVPQTQSFDEHDEELGRLQDRLELVEDEKAALALEVQSLSKDLEGKKMEIFHLRQELEEKEEEVECLESQFTAQSNVIESLREEKREQRALLEAEEDVSVDNRKGNSLFAEVDDRRVVAEKQMVGVVSKLSHMEERLTKSQEENKRLKKQMAILRQSATKGYDSAVVKDLQTQLKESKVKVIEVTEQLHKELRANRKKSKSDVNTPLFESLKDSDKAFEKYLQVINNDQNKQIAELKSTADREHVQMLHTDLRLTQVCQQVTALTQERDSLKMANTQLSMEIRELQLQYEPEQECDLGKVTFDSAQKSVPLSEKNGAIIDHPTTKSKTHKNQNSSKSNSNMKENDPLSMITQILSGGAQTTKERTVRMADTVCTISDDGVTKESQLDSGATSGRKLKSSAAKSGSSKFRSVTKSSASEEGPAECKQQ